MDVLVSDATSEDESDTLSVVDGEKLVDELALCTALSDTSRLVVELTLAELHTDESALLLALA